MTEPYLLFIVIAALLIALCIFLAKPSKSLTTEEPAVSDGLIDLNAAASPSREEWQFPLLARFKNWVIGFGAAALLIVGCLYAFYLYQRPDVTYVETKPAIADMGIPISKPAKQLSVKTAIKRKAAQAINTPDIAINSPEITTPAAPLEPLTPAEQDFANRLAIFESKTL